MILKNDEDVGGGCAVLLKPVVGVEYESISVRYAQCLFLSQKQQSIYMHNIHAELFF